MESDIPQPRPMCSQEYLRIERASSGDKFFFLHGKRVHKPYSTFVQCRMAANLAMRISEQIDGTDFDCLNSMIRVGSRDRELYFYAEIPVFSGRPIHPDRHHDILLDLHAIVMIEFEDQSRLELQVAMEAMKRMPTLREIVIVSQSQRRFIQMYRLKDQWMIVNNEDSVVDLQFQTLPVRMTWDEILDRTDFCRNDDSDEPVIVESPS